MGSGCAPVWWPTPCTSSSTHSRISSKAEEESLLVCFFTQVMDYEIHLPTKASDLEYVTDGDQTSPDGHLNIATFIWDTPFIVVALSYMLHRCQIPMLCTIGTAPHAGSLAIPTWDWHGSSTVSSAWSWLLLLQLFASEVCLGDGQQIEH